MRLPPDEAHVWRASLLLDPPELARWECSLAPDERERLVRFRSPADRARFTAARGILRSLLGEYLQAPPAEIRFRYGENGKPELAPPWSDSGLHFNLAHAADLALLAFATGRRVGVDAERVRPVSVMERVAGRIFPEAALATWRALPAEQKLHGFFERWTRQEALAKLHGEGLWRVAGREAKQEAITLRPLAMPPGYVAAVAVEGTGVGVVERLADGG